jgi:hypothetical protein
MDQQDKEYLAHTLRSVAGGSMFVFAMGFIISSPGPVQWIALAGSVVFWIAGSFVKSSCDLDTPETLLKEK